MNITPTTIKGAVYSDSENDEILLIPHYSGSHWIVDCNQYHKKDSDHWGNFDDGLIDFDELETLKYDNELYYLSPDYSPFHTHTMQLESDISDLYFINEEF